MQESTIVVDRRESLPPPGSTAVKVHLYVPEDQARHLPRHRHAPEYLPPDMPVPRQGDVVYLAPHSAWAVYLVIYQWDRDALHIEVWLEHVSSSRHTRPTGFALTQ